MKKKLLFIFGVLLLFSLLLWTFFSQKNMTYGVFLGIDRDQISYLDAYDIVVIEPSEFTEEDIHNLQEQGKVVYGYLNVGAIEEYRSYFGDYEDLTLGVYEEWPDERWMDVSDNQWQSFIQELGQSYIDMGFDGLFIDNCDVYYHYNTDEIFDGLCFILDNLKSENIDIMINGADTFVKRCINEEIALDLFDSVNQETVFTTLNDEEQDTSETAYFQEYLAKVKENQIDVYLLEYGADVTLSKEIDAYCTENGFLWFNAKSVNLDKN